MLKEGKMISWLIIALVVVVLFLILKYREIRHKLSFIVILVLLLVLGVTFWNVYSTNHLKLDSFDGVTRAGKVYFSWLGSVFGNLKGLTAYAIKQDWVVGDGGSNVDVYSSSSNLSSAINSTK